MFKILSTYVCLKKYIKCNIWRVAVRPSYIQDARFLKVKHAGTLSCGKLQMPNSKEKLLQPIKARLLPYVQHGSPSAASQVVYAVRGHIYNVCILQSHTVITKQLRIPLTVIFTSAAREPAHSPCCSPLKKLYAHDMHALTLKSSICPQNVVSQSKGRLLP